MSKHQSHYLNDPDGMRLPIKVDSNSNSEFMPRALNSLNEYGNSLALSNCDENARRVGKSRRSFLVSSAGTATTLLAFNEATAYDLKVEEVQKHTNKDPVNAAKGNYLDIVDPSYLTYGPKNKRQFLGF